MNIAALNNGSRDAVDIDHSGQRTGKPEIGRFTPASTDR